LRRRSRTSATTRHRVTCGAPNGRFLHPVRAQVAGAGSVAGSELALREVPTSLSTVLRKERRLKFQMAACGYAVSRIEKNDRQYVRYHTNHCTVLVCLSRDTYVPIWFVKG
jgi:hypothetical protein